MAVHDQDMSSGKNGVNKAINAGRSAGKLLFSKGTSSLLLSGQTVGIAGFFGVIIILLVFMIMTMPMSTLTSTKESYDKAANFMEDQLYHAYDEAARQVATQIKDSASAPFDDGGYNCGNVIVEFGYFEFTAGADFLNTGVTHEPNYRDENENYTYIRTDGEKIEVDEEGERPSDEERDSHRSACTIKVNFYPTLTQESGIIGAYVEAANGTINNMPEEAYEEGYVTDDIIAAMKTENANAEDLQNENDIFESEEKYESFMSKYGTKYNSITSDEFQRDFEAFVKRGTAKYFYKGQRKTESYEARTNPIFYALYNHKMFENEDAEESIISTTEEIKDQTQVCFSGHVDTDTGRCETNFIYGAASNDSAIDCVNRGECEFSYKYKYYSTFLYEMEITVPILYDISGYRQREFDNLYEAFKNAGMDPDFYGEYVQDALNANYQHTL